MFNIFFIFNIWSQLLTSIIFKLSSIFQELLKVQINVESMKMHQAERHDFWPRLWLFSSPFLFRPIKQGRRKGEWIAKIVIKIHAFLLDNFHRFNIYFMSFCSIYENASIKIVLKLWRSGKQIDHGVHQITLLLQKNRGFLVTDLGPKMFTLASDLFLKKQKICI